MIGKNSQLLNTRFCLKPFPFVPCAGIFLCCVYVNEKAALPLRKKGAAVKINLGELTTIQFFLFRKTDESMQNEN